METFILDINVEKVCYWVMGEVKQSKIRLKARFCTNKRTKGNLSKLSENQINR